MASLSNIWPTLLQGETLEAHPSSSHHCQVANLEASLILLLYILILILIFLHSHRSSILPPGLQVSMCSLFSCILTAAQASAALSHSSPKEPPSRKSYSNNPKQIKKQRDDFNCMRDQQSILVHHLPGCSQLVLLL